MRLAAAIACLGLAVGGVLAARSTGHASDHLDGPRAVADPSADIADVFAFTSPEPGRQGRVVLAMTVWPYAAAPDAADASPSKAASAAFSTQVDYVFRVRRVAVTQPLTLDPMPLDITCAFDEEDGAPPQVSCSAPGGTQASANVGDTGSAPSDGPMRVFAGLRADPAFFDRQGARATLASGRLSFTGDNAFAGANVLALVVEVDAAVLLGGAESPVLAVAAETIRRSR
jgi:hypothetical protein